MTLASPFAAPNGSSLPAAAPMPGTSAPPPPDTTTPAPTPAPSPAVPIATGPPPQIVPNRRRLDNHFPVLAFNIRTLGRPWFEVLLTTDRSLFASENAGRRVPANFYASREHGGLTRADTEDVAYVVPASVLRRFADARPRPAQIYYTVAAYPAPDAPPTLAQPPETLVSAAPSVALGADFAAQTMAMVLGIPTEKLVRVDRTQPVARVTSVELDDDGIPVDRSASWSSEDEETRAEVAAAAAWAQAEDPGEAAMESVPAPSVPGVGAYEPEPAIERAERWAPNADVEAYAADYGEPSVADLPAEPSRDRGYDVTPVDSPRPAHDLDYDDGYGALAEDTWDSEQGVRFGAAAVEPAELPDEHDHVDDDLRHVAESRAQADYGDEAEAYDPYATGAQAAPPPGSAAPVAPAPGTAAGPAAGAPTAPAPGAPVPTGAVPAGAPVPAAPNLTSPFTGPVLTEDAKIALLHKIGHRFETSRPHPYRSCERDFEFNARNLPQYQRWHVGLTYGFFGFTQDSGSLGHLLERFKRVDETTFRSIFGPHADELIAVTTARGPEGRHSPGGRSARVQPVAGHDLWEDEWVHRFEAAGDVPAFQREQDRMAVAYFVDPMLPMASAFGMDTERALGMLVDRAGHQGSGGATRWLLRAMSPLQPDAVRQQALNALGFPGVREFQHARGLHADGDFGPRTHIALAAAVRRLGPNSPVPFPTREQLMDAIVTAAEHEWWNRRPREMRTASEFGDVPLSWTASNGR